MLLRFPLVHLLLPGGILAMLVLPPAACALDVEQVVWGFDGQAVSGRFNILSVELSNPTPQPFDGELVLLRNYGPGGAVGADLVQPVYLGPFESSRWVQFYPFVLYEYEEWSLSWKGGSQGLGSPPHRPRDKRQLQPVVVLLDDPDRPARRGGGLKRLPDHLFPPMQSATDTLDAVVLDHAPRWQQPRLRAFRDWLHRGGHVHLLQDESGRHPQFPPDLAELNAPARQSPVGLGRVVRHERPLAGVDNAFVRSEIELPLIDEEDPAQTEEPGLDGMPLQPAGMYATHENYRYWIEENFRSRVFGTLRRMTLPDHNWPLLYLLALVYVGLIFPGFFLLARRRIDYRVVYGLLLAAVAAFSWMFSFIGRRGYGETTTTNTVAIARPLPEGAWDVAGWTDAFVTDGEIYSIRHEGSGILYSTAQGDERVRGTIVCGAGAEFRVDIPPYSSRSLAWRMKLRSEGPQPAIVEWSPDAPPYRVVLEPGEPWRDLPNAPVYAVYGDRICEASLEGGQVVIPTAQGVSFESFLQMVHSSEPEYGFFHDDERISQEERYRRLHLPLCLRAIEPQGTVVSRLQSLPPGRLRLLLYGSLPDSMRIAGDALGRQNGRVLYVVDVTAPGGL